MQEFTLPENLTIDDVMAEIESDSNTGFCLRCGLEAGFCEPDAREYECESCGAMAVHGAMEILVMFA